MRLAALILLLALLAPPEAGAQTVTGQGFAFPSAPDAGPYEEVGLPRLHAPGDRLSGRYVRVVNDLLVPDSLRDAEGFYDLEDPHVVTPHAGAPRDFRHAPGSAASTHCEVRRTFLASYGQALDCSHFDDVNVYHHIDLYADRFWRARLGYAPPFQAVVVTHRAGGGGFAHALARAVYLGDGGIYMKDVARERDLVLHEYVHLVTAALGLATTTESPEQTWALAEGYADYFAATYTGSPRLGAWVVTCPARGECVGPPNDPDLRTLATDPAVWNWRDGAPDAGLRYGVCTRYHPGDGKCKTTYNNNMPTYTWGMIWGGALWDLRTAVGADVADRIVYEGLRRTATPETTLDEAAADLVAAAAALYEGRYEPVVRSTLAARGFARAAAVDAERPAPRPALALRTYPNPAPEAVTAAFDLDAAADVEVAVYDVLGRRLARLAAGPYPAGQHTATWAADVAPGVYLVRLRAGTAVRTSPVVVVR